MASLKTHLFRTGAVVGLAGAAAGYALLFRPLLRSWGATDIENAATYPGDDLIEGAERTPVMAVTLDAPPEAVWPWLAQMGADRGGFYSWDRLDNGGRPSATELNPEWTDIRAGDRIASTPDGEHWFNVELAEPPHELILRAPFVLPSGRMFDPSREKPKAFIDGTWAFHLRELPGGRTRLLVSGVGLLKPKLPNQIVSWLIMEPVHWFMQVKQFRELRRRVESSTAG